MPKEIAIPLIIVGVIALIYLILTILMGSIYFNRVFRRKKVGANPLKDNDPAKEWLSSLPHG